MFLPSTPPAASGRGRGGLVRRGVTGGLLTVHGDDAGARSPLRAPDQTVVLSMSLKGFTAGIDRITELNNANAAAIEKAKASAE